MARMTRPALPRDGVLALAMLLALGCRDAPVSSVANDTSDAPPSMSGPAPAAAAPTAAPAPSAEPQGDAPPVRKDNTIFAESELMGTRVTVNVWLPPEHTAREAGAAIQASFDEMARIESIMSEWQPGSELSRFNRAAGGEMIALSPELTEVLARAREIAELTGGAFDPTFHGVGQLWSFQPGATPPTKAEVAEKLPLIAWRDLEVDPKARRGRLARAGMMVGLGAIAKGYAVDRASALLHDLGFPHHVVEAGGDTYARGTKGGKKWMVGIQKPGARGIVAALPSSDESVVTSGDYQRYFEHEGVRYAHILDPRTGWPIPERESPQSVTLVAPNATDADAFATAVAVMGPDAGMRFVESQPTLEAVVITHEGDVRVSSGLQSRLVYP
jgi:thiamine biosynthesis lipoprotein